MVRRRIVLSPLPAGRILGDVRERIINGREWVDQRIAFLRGRLKEALSDEERRSIESEIEALDGEDPLSCDPTSPWIPTWPFRHRRRCRQPGQAQDAAPAGE
jgi:hypothetical protein